MTLALGLLITVLAMFTSWTYFNTPAHLKNQVGFFWLNTLNQKITDIKMRVRGNLIPKPEYAVVAIDERSLQALGRWPWPREKMARLLEEIKSLGAESIGLDIIFPEPSNEELLNVIHSYSEIKGLSQQALDSLKEHSQRQKQYHDSDQILAQTFRAHQDSLVAGKMFEIPRGAFLPYQRLCMNTAYQKSTAFNTLDRYGFEFIHIIQDAKLKVVEELPRSIEKILSKNLTDFAKEQKDTLTAYRKYCGNWLTLDDPYREDYEQAWRERQKKRKKPILLSLREYLEQHSFYPSILLIDEWRLNIPTLTDATAMSGFLNTLIDNDGVIRRVPLVVRSGPHIFPALSLRMAMKKIGADGGQVLMREDPTFPGHLMITGIELTKDAEVTYQVPVDKTGSAQINFHGPHFSLPHISAKEILEPETTQLLINHIDHSNSSGLKIDRLKPVNKTRYLKGKTVIIGLTAPGVNDLRTIPFDEYYPGVEAHLALTENIVEKKVLRSFAQEAPWMVVVLLLLGLSLSLILSWLGAVTGALLSLFVFFAILIYDYQFLFLENHVWSVGFPLGLILLLYSGLTLFKYFTEERTKRNLRNTFEKFVSPSIVRKILEHPDNVKLGGQKQNMSVFFSDVRGFTTISESLEPEALSSLLNEYLTPMTDLVFEHNGTLDKYMGDAIMAFFGAPIPNTHHADDACRCALRHIERLKELNKELEAKEFPLLDIGIGINTGDMSVGNMGSETVRNYTVMGDSVNLGARLEGINKQYGTRIIISEYTHDALKCAFTTREIDWVKVKGKDKPVRIFELMGEGVPADETLQMLTHFKRGYHHYHQKHWDKAIEEFKLGIEHVPNDPVCKLYINRSHEFLAHPPEGDWDGVFVMKTK